MGKHGSLKKNLVESFLNENNHVVATRKQGDAKFSDEHSERLTVFEYNYRSLLSTRTLFLECRNKHIEHIIIVYSIIDQSDVLRGFQSGIIEQKIDEDMKGFLYLLRESVSYLEKQESGSINIVLHNTGPEIPGPLEALMFHGIEALGTSLFTYYSMDRYSVRGYKSRSQECAEYAEFIMKSIGSGQPSGKWYRYQREGRFFSRSRN